MIVEHIHWNAVYTNEASQSKLNRTLSSSSVSDGISLSSIVIVTLGGMSVLNTLLSVPLARGSEHSLSGVLGWLLEVFLLVSFSHKAVGGRELSDFRLV